MTQTTIYLSVICGTDSLTLDGNLYLFRELLASLTQQAKEPTETRLAVAIQPQENQQEGKNVSG
jgi:hypothetical protein